jgi:TIR domain
MCENNFAPGPKQQSVKEKMSRRRGSEGQYLFREFDFYSLQERQLQQMAMAIANADPGGIITGDVDQSVKQFSEQFSLDAPQLIEGAVSVTVNEAKVDVTGDIRFGAFGPGTHYAAGIEVSYYVPYSGEKAMFNCKPSTWSSVLPVAELGEAELKMIFARPDQDVAVTKVEFDRELSLIKQYLEWLRENCRTFNLALATQALGQIESRRSRLAQISQGVQSLGVPIRRAVTPAERTHPSSSTHRSPRAAEAVPAVRYDVALSFAGENRRYVEEVANGLKAVGVSVFYDGFERADLWGKNLIEHLAEIYGKRSRFVVMFISKEYVEKAWTTHERRHAQDRALLAQSEYILPARFDDTAVPGMTTTVGFQDLRHMRPGELVDIVVAKLRQL